MDKKSRSKKRRHNRRRIKNAILRKDVLLIAAIILIPIIIFLGLKYFESDLLAHTQDEDRAFNAKAITVDGVDYYPRRDITVLMLLGLNVDDSENKTGEAALLVADNTASSYSILRLNTEAIAKMPSLTLINTNMAKDICTQSRAAISEALNNIYIDHYAAVNSKTLDLDVSNLINLSVSEILFGNIEFIATDCSLKVLSKLADNMSGYTHSETVTVNPDDENALQQTVLKYFYKTK